MLCCWSSPVWQWCDPISQQSSTIIAATTNWIVCSSLKLWCCLIFFMYSFCFPVYSFTHVFPGVLCFNKRSFLMWLYCRYMAHLTTPSITAAATDFLPDEVSELLLITVCFSLNQLGLCAHLISSHHCS